MCCLFVGNGAADAAHNGHGTKGNGRVAPTALLYCLVVNGTMKAHAHTYIKSGVGRVGVRFIVELKENLKEFCQLNQLNVGAQTVMCLGHLIKIRQ